MCVGADVMVMSQRRLMIQCEGSKGMDQRFNIGNGLTGKRYGDGDGDGEGE